MRANLPEAFAFTSPFDLDTILEKLKLAGSFEWKGVDSDTYGDYLMGTPLSSEWPVTFRLFIDTPGYVLDMGYSYWQLKEGQSADYAIAFLKDILLPAISAADVKEVAAFR